MLGFARDIQGRIAHDISASLTGALFGFPKGGEGADATKLVGGFLHGGGIGNFFSSIFGRLFGGGRASGGDMSPGRFYMAGEHGRELIWMGGNSGYAFNHNETRGMMNSSRGEERITFALGDRAVAEAIEDHRKTSRSRRSRFIEGKWNRKLQTVSY